MQFSQVIGQEELLQSIKKLIDSNHFPHAVLLSGKDGYGNLAIALSVGQYISCIDKQGKDDSCGVCSSCRKYDKLIHPDLHFVFPNTTTSKVDKDNESQLFMGLFRDFVLKYKGYCSLSNWYEFLGSNNKQGIINVRDANTIIKSLTIKTFESKYKVMIIWNADKMNAECSDKILKIIEEPYPNTIFILTTEHKDRIIPTILSRVQQIKVPPLDDKAMTKAIKAIKGENLSQDTINQYIDFCQGNYNEIQNIGSEQQILMTTNFVKLNQLAMQFLTKADQIEEFADYCQSLTREQIKAFLSYCLDMIEKIYRFNNGGSFICNPLWQTSEKFQANYPNFITKNNINHLYKIFNEAIANTENNVNNKINIIALTILLGKHLKNK